MSSGVGLVRFVFNWPHDRGMRRFLMEQCAMEIYESGLNGTSRFCHCEGAASSLTDARFTIRVARCLPFLGFRILGLKELWLELMGCRIALSGRYPMSGLDTLRAVAAQEMDIDPIKAGKMTVDDLYRTYCSAPLNNHWHHKREKFTENCARYGRNPVRLARR